MDHVSQIRQVTFSFAKIKTKKEKENVATDLLCALNDQKKKNKHRYYFKHMLLKKGLLQSEQKSYLQSLV